MIGKYVVCTTSTRPWCIVAGVLQSNDDGKIEISDARMIVYYGAGTKGLFGVAAHGPKGHARVTSKVDLWRGFAVEQVMVATDEAQAAIEAEPWM